MKILQICNKVPYPTNDGGAIAVLNLSLSLSDQGHEVTILAMRTSKHGTSLSDIPDKLKKKIDFQLVPVNTSINYFKLILNLFFSKTPYNAVRFIDKLFEKKLIELLHKKDFDVIQLEGLYLVPYVQVIRNNCTSLIAFRSHNIESEIWSRIKRITANPIKRFYFGVIAKRLGDLEIDSLNSYDLLIPITERDASTFKGLGNRKPMKVIPVGLPDKLFEHSKSVTRSAGSLFFIGALDWIPNQEGLLWFLDKVWVNLIKSFPEAEFHIAGRNAPAWIKNRCQGKGIQFHGEIEDAHAFMDSYDIMIVPLFAGSGMRVKIIEAMARSKTVITTDIGAEGLGVVSGKHIIIANTANEFLTGIDRLIKEDDFFGKIQENAFVYTQQNYDNNKLTFELVEFYKNHLTC